MRGLHRATFQQLCGEHGLAEAKASQLKAALELGYRLQRESPEERPAIHSPDDVAVTRAIVQAGKLLEIEVLDHLVIGTNTYVSLKNRGLGFG